MTDDDIIERLEAEVERYAREGDALKLLRARVRLIYFFTRITTAYADGEDIDTEDALIDIDFEAMPERDRPAAIAEAERLVRDYDNSVRLLRRGSWN
ncbi:hypothetical protein [Sphingobium yanoikuyae]|uniref:hypothetical protein n=1 Tax=Sphingobium yanoikuyae TaxID=13690 RepID=UPI0012D300CD|nr:hypothetical protein [Sphingobium yanoikuyae]MDV3480081.1 hypothetical protein [Sphingobium yanoikuyae]